MRDVESDWVVVSGAAGSLGSAIVRHYAASGCRVLAIDRHMDVLAPLQSACVTVRCCEATSPDEIRDALSVVPRTAAIANLVNAVGLIANEPVVGLRSAKLVVHDIDIWRAVIDSNLTASFVVASQVAARMVRRGGGAIVNFSSISARGNAGQAAYAAAKAGVEGMTRAMAAELGPMGVRVNAVAPGFVDVTSTHDALPEQKRVDYVARTPLRRLASIDEIVQAVDFLATNAFVNGVVLDFDGGLRL